MKRILKRPYKLLREYTLFSLTVLIGIIALSLQLTDNDSVANWLLIGMSGIALIPLLIGMWQSLRNGSYGVDILAATAIIASLVLGEYWTALVIVLMLTGGEALEKYAGRRAKKELSALLDRAPRKAHLLKSGNKVIDVAVEKIAIGDKILVKPGEVIPADGTIIDGTASIDESNLTGESIPQTKQVNDSILSGSVNLDGLLTIKVIHSAKDSQYEQIIKLVKSADATHTPFVRLADRYAIPFTIVSFAIAGGAWFFSGDPLRFLQVIVVATPCPLILAAPIAIISGMSRASKHGIIIKSGGALERLAEAKTIAFDKTGTLTLGRPVLKEIKPAKGFESNDVLGAAAGLEQHSNHSIAHAVVSAAKELNITFRKVKNVTEIPGLGLTGSVGTTKVIAGRLQLLEENGITIPKLSKSHTASTSVYVAIDGTFAGYIILADKLREEAVSTIERLRKLGIKHLIMVTGDSKATAMDIAGKLGITQVKAEALPADKIIEIENAKYRPVAFVGDGVNDAPVLTVSDIGIALGARGSTAASESADMVIMLDNVSKVAEATYIAKNTFRIARQSILIGIGLSLILMAIFATGRFAPIYGAAIQELVDVVVILNALRAHGSFRTQTATNLSV